METCKKDSLRFDGKNYSIWKNRMECHLRCIGEPFQNITCNRCVVGQIDESKIVAKVLRSFPVSYKVKATTIEEL